MDEENQPATGMCECAYPHWNRDLTRCLLCGRYPRAIDKVLGFPPEPRDKDEQETESV